MSFNRGEYEKEVANKIIKALEEGTAPWVRPWRKEEFLEPYNYTTNKAYSGMNSLILSLSGYGDPRWLTFKQAQSLNLKVKKGAKSTLIQYCVTKKMVDKLDENKKPLRDENGKKIKEEVILDKPMIVFAYVFNGEQIEGMPKFEKKSSDKKLEFNPIKEAEEILKNSSAIIEHKGNESYYSLSRDKIILPAKEQFLSKEGYYSTALHELAHWSGHPNRLNRDLNHKFGSIGYAKEELRAEISSYLLCQKLKLDFDPNNHIAYIDSWIQIIKDKPNEIFLATKDAIKINNFIDGFNKSIKKENNKKNLKEVNYEKTIQR